VSIPFAERKGGERSEPGGPRLLRPTGRGCPLLGGKARPRGPQSRSPRMNRYDVNLQGESLCCANGEARRVACRSGAARHGHRTSIPPSLQGSATWPADTVWGCSDIRRRNVESYRGEVGPQASGRDGNAAASAPKVEQPRTGSPASRGGSSIPEKSCRDSAVVFQSESVWHASWAVLPPLQARAERSQHQRGLVRLR
jgi:hypothetical protein